MREQTGAVKQRSAPGQKLFAGLSPLQIGLTRDRHICKEIRQLVQTQRLRTINQGFRWVRVKINQHHVGSGDDRLRCGVE